MARRGHQQGARGHACRAEHGARRREALGQMRVQALDEDYRLINEQAHRQGQAAKRHDVHRLAGRPQADDRSEQRERERGDDNERAAEIAQKQQHHEPRQEGAQQAFGHEVPYGRHHVL